jgi:hypothetical protein
LRTRYFTGHKQVYLYLLTYRYVLSTKETLASVRSVEASLKRLKKVKRGNTAASVTGGEEVVTDDVKIRKQISIDVEQFGREIGEFKIECGEYEGLVAAVREDEAAANE